MGYRSRIAGIGIGMPFRLWDWVEEIGAPTEVMDAWRTTDVRARIEEVCDFPVYLENDTTAACGAELVFGESEEARDFLYFYIGYFIGGGIVLNGSLYPGRSGNAGALGSMPVPANDGSGWSTTHPSCKTVTTAMPRIPGSVVMSAKST